MLGLRTRVGVLSFFLLVGCGPASPEQKLRNALRSGDVAKVQALVDAGQKLDHQFEGGATALHVIADANRDAGDVARYLVEQGADVNAKDEDGRTPWDAALAQGSGKSRITGKRSNVLIVLLEGGYAPSKDPGEEGKTALHEVAVRVQSARVVELLIKGGFDANVRDDDGWTPLHHAALANNNNAATGLLGNGADANAETAKTVGHSYSRGGSVTWTWRYEAGSRPLDVVKQTRGRNEEDVRDVIGQYGGTSNAAVTNKKR